MTFQSPGFEPAEPFNYDHLVGEGALGAPDGSENNIVASASGHAALSVRHPAGALSEFGAAGACLFSEFQFMLVGVYHPDGQTYGPTPAPAEAPNPFCYFVEHFGFGLKP